VGDEAAWCCLVTAALAGSGSTTGNKDMKDSARYVKIVEWSEEDQCYVGSCPGLLLGGCHGDDERTVFEELCEIVEEVVALYHADDKLRA
jgi:hypothetical protein